MFHLATTVSFRHLLRKKGRLFLTVWGISLGVAMIMAITIVNNSVLSSFYQLADSVSGRASLQVISSADSGFPVTALDSVLAVPDVTAASPVVRRNTFLHSAGQEWQVLVYGVDLELDMAVREYILHSGRFWETNAGDSLILTRSMADQMGLALGDQLQLLTVDGLATFSIVGLLEPTGPAQTNGGRFAIIPIKSAQTHFARQGKFDSIDIVLNREARTEEQREAIQAKVGEEVLVVTPAHRGEEVDEMLAALRQVLSLASAISLVVGAFLVYNNISVGIQERRKEFGILRCLGAEAIQIRRVVMVESMLIGLLGSVLGIVTGAVLARFMGVGLGETVLAMYRFDITSLSLRPRDLLMALGAGIGVSLLAGLPASQEILRLKPVEVVRSQRAIESTAYPRWPRTGTGLMVAGILMATVALTWKEPSKEVALGLGSLGFAFAGVGWILLAPVAASTLGQKLGKWGNSARLAIWQMGLQNAARRPGRIGSTMVALTVAIAMLVGMGGMIRSFKTSVSDWTARAMGWDLMVSSGFAVMGADVTLPESFQSQILETPGVKVAAPERFSMVTLEGRPAYLAVFDMQVFPQYGQLDIIEGDAENLYAKLQEGQVAINNPMAQQRNLKVGDTLRFETPTGPVKTQVAAVVNTLFSAIGAVYMDRGFYVGHWQDSTADTFVVKVASGASLEEVAHRITEQPSLKHLKVLTNQAYRKQIDDMMAQSMGLIDGLLYVAMVVGALGVANTLFISVMERRRELALLRAVGSSRPQLFTVVLSEAVMIGVVSGVVGTALGALLSLLMIQQIGLTSGMILERYVSIISVVVGLAMAFILAPLAGLLPARAAVGFSITTAVRDE